MKTNDQQVFGGPVAFELSPALRKVFAISFFNDIEKSEYLHWRPVCREIHGFCQALQVLQCASVSKVSRCKLFQDPESGEWRKATSRELPSATDGVLVSWQETNEFLDLLGDDLKNWQPTRQ